MFLEIPVSVNLQCSVLTEQWKRGEVLRAAIRARGRYGSVYLGVDVLRVCEVSFMCIREVWVVQWRCIF